MPTQRTEQVWKNFKKVCGLWKENESEKILRKGNNKGNIPFSFALHRPATSSKLFHLFSTRCLGIVKRVSKFSSKIIYFCTFLIENEKNIRKPDIALTNSLYVLSTDPPPF